MNCSGHQQEYEQIASSNLRVAITGTLPDVAIHGMNRQRILVERGIAQPIDDLIIARTGLREARQSPERC